MQKIIAIILTLTLCLTATMPLTSFAEGEPVDDPLSAEDAGQDAGNTGEETAVTAVSPAFQQKQFAGLLADGKLIKPESMADVTISETTDKQGILITGKPDDIMSGRLMIAEEFDFDEKPEGRNTDVRPVGRISVDGLSDKKIKATVNIYLDDDPAPVASMLLKKQMGKNGWIRRGDLTADVLDLNITGQHSVSIGLDIENGTADEDTSVLLRSFTFCENSIPVMYFNIDESESSIDAMNASEDHSVECYGTVRIQVPEGYKGEFSNKALTSTDPLPLEYIRGRGNSTWYADKKPYKVKLDGKENLLGMGKNAHWVLLANRFDNSFLRNRMTYWIGRQLDMEFTPKCEPVEVVMNGVYYGSYLLSQQIRVGKTRVEINNLEDDGKTATEEPLITGGYLLNMEGGEDEETSISTEHGMYLGIESPDFSKYGNSKDNLNAIAAQIKYIRDYIGKVESALFGKNYTDEEGHSYKEYLDEQSAVDYWWIQEFSANGDAFAGGSNYLYKKRDEIAKDGTVTTPGLLYWGPLWDFDFVAWGDLDYSESTCEGFDNTSNGWMSRLRTSDEYINRLRARWSADEDKEGRYAAHLSDCVTEVTKEGGILDQYYDETRVSQLYDNYKWGYYGERGGYYSYDYGQQDDEGDGQTEDENGEEEQTVQTYETEVEQLRGWINRRQAWVNDNLESIGADSYTVKIRIDGRTIETRKYLPGDVIGSLPKAPKKTGYTFIGWYSSASGERMTERSEVWESFSLTAKYVKTSKLKNPKNIYFRNYRVYCWLSSYDEDDVYYPDYVFMPDGSRESKITWSVSNKKIATVSRDGGVRGLKPGTVTVTATLKSGIKNSYKITFIDDGEMLEPESITLNKTSLKMKTGGYFQLKADIDPKPNYSGDLTWLSTDPKVVSADYYGILRAKKPGKALVIALDTDSRLFKVCKVTVTATKAYRIRVAKAKKVRGVKAKVLKKGSQRKVRVSWKKASGVTGYYVLRASKKNGKYRRVGTVSKARTVKWTDTKVRKGKRYFYKVRPFTKIGKKKYAGKRSAAVSVKVK